MKYDHFSPELRSAYPIAILVSTINKDRIKKEYLDPFKLSPNAVLLIEVYKDSTRKRTPVKVMKEFISNDLQGVLDDFGIQHIICGDPDYFKLLHGGTKTEVNLGAVLPSVYGSQSVIYVPNYQSVFYNPEVTRDKISSGILALKDYIAGTYVAPGSDIIKEAHYPKSITAIMDMLDNLLTYPKLRCDIETFSLRPHTAGIGTIGFSWEEGKGTAFPVDYGLSVQEAHIVRGALKRFFKNYKGTLVFHNITFDAMVLIYQLYMKDITDTEGFLKGIKEVMRSWEDTKIITYLATNTCAGNNLGLKELAQSYAGNWGLVDIKDITKIPLDELLEYNLVDCLSTGFVEDTYTPIMIADNQKNIYEEIFKPAVIDIIQMQLTGLPVNMERVKEARAVMEADYNAAITGIRNNPLIQDFVRDLNQDWVDKKNATLKVKRVTLDDAKEEFNPGSDIQVSRFLFTRMGLPVLAFTDSGAASTSGDVIKNLKNHTTDPLILDFLDKMIAFKAVAIILSTFIPALEDAVPSKDGWHYMIGNFNLGGTKSGRLSSNNPNLQNLPAGGKYAYWIKYCIQAPKGYLIMGLDFNSLEDMISALTTRDPNKLKVYTDGYDGHSLRAYSYFGDQMKGINPDSVSSINSIAKKYPDLRQESKPPTFALTYQGTYRTLMSNCGFPIEKAQMIEQRFREFYSASIQWVNEKLNEATRKGYVEVAFGLRLRTPLLHQVVRGLTATPYEAEAEGRTAGNALGQSWCMLNMRAVSKFMEDVRKSKYKLLIRPCAQIHDASYYLVPDNLEVVHYLNTNLVKHVRWQDHPDIYHETVKIGGEAGIFFPDWNNEITLPNGIDKAGIQEIVTNYIKSVKDKTNG